jgi:hypothetical protein
MQPEIEVLSFIHVHPYKLHSAVYHLAYMCRVPPAQDPAIGSRLFGVVMRSLLHTEDSECFRIATSMYGNLFRDEPRLRPILLDILLPETVSDAVISIEWPRDAPMRNLWHSVGGRRVLLHVPRTDAQKATYLNNMVIVMLFMSRDEQFNVALYAVQASHDTDMKPFLPVLSVATDMLMPTSASNMAVTVQAITLITTILSACAGGRSVVEDFIINVAPLP